MRSNKLFLAILSGLLLSAGWPSYGFAPLLFFAFVPLLLLEDKFYTKYELRPGLIFRYSYLTFFTWNLLTTWWVYNASFGGAILAIVFNSLFFAIVFMFYHVARKIAGLGFLVFVSFWLTFEYVHINWELSWPWLTLGNGLAGTHSIIQWYEYTGVFGGSLWILTLNYILYHGVKMYLLKEKKKAYTAGAAALVFVLVPALISYNIYTGYREKSDPSNIVVVQPNIDPYNEKFDGMSPEQQLAKMLNLAAEKADQQTDYIVFPETALTENVWEDQLNDCFSLSMMRAFIRHLPRANMVTGLSSNKVYKTRQEVTATARKFRDADIYYDSFNTAMQLSNAGEVQLYHKSKLVPGVEKMPFPKLLKPLEKLAIDLGGTSGSLGIQTDRTVFFSSDKTGVAPVICYESIYGEFVSDYVKKGANLLFIITNDGWWGDTPGYKQHLAYGKLRAIETRRSIARSANTGISCFIDQRGDVYSETRWWEAVSIKGTLNKNSETTFYVRHGDYIGRILSYFALVFFILMVLGVVFRVGRKAKA